VRGVIISQEVQLFFNQKNTEHNKQLQPQVSMFQTVCSGLLHQQAMVVHYFAALQCNICLLSLPLSKKYKQWRICFA
jgi:hypothetical protein